GQRVWPVGERAPMANVVKLACNFALASTIETLGEAGALAQAHGIEPRTLYEVMTGSLFASPAWRVYAGLIGEQRFEPAGFRMPLGLKDVRLALQAGEASHTPLPIASLLRDHFLAAIANGDAEKDWSALALTAFRNAVGDRLQEVVAQQRGDRQRCVAGLAGLQRQADVLQAERHPKPGRLEALLADQPCVDAPGRRGEERAGHHLIEGPGLDPVGLGERAGFAQGLDRAGQREVAGQLDHIGHRRALADRPDSLADQFQQRPHLGDRAGSPAASTCNWPAAAASGRPSTGAAT